MSSVALVAWLIHFWDAFSLLLFIRVVENRKIQGLFQNWCSLSLNGLVRSSVEIPTESAYSVEITWPKGPGCTVDA